MVLHKGGPAIQTPPSDCGFGIAAVRARDLAAPGRRKRCPKSSAASPAWGLRCWLGLGSLGAPSGSSIHYSPEALATDQDALRGVGLPARSIRLNQQPEPAVQRSFLAQVAENSCAAAVGAGERNERQSRLAPRKPELVLVADCCGMPQRGLFNPRMQMQCSEITPPVDDLKTLSSEGHRSTACQCGD